MYKTLFFTTISIFTIFSIGCGGPAANNANGAKPNTNSTVVINGNTGLNPTPKPISEKTNDAPTLGPIVKTYYEALKKKDDALLKTVLSKDLLKTMEEGMKEEKKKGLAAYAAELDRVPENGIEVRNEKIQGNKGSAELKGGAYVNWSSIGFVMEDGKWKMSNESSETEAVKPNNPPPPNTAK